MIDIDSLKQMFDMHIKECDQRDVRNTDSINELKNMFKGIWNAQDRLGEKITSMQIRAAFFLGGIIVIGKILDYALAWHGAK